MHFTNLGVLTFENGEVIYHFYDNEVMAACFHEADLTFEWQQLAFILQRVKRSSYYEAISWEPGSKELVVHGADRHDLINLDCQLLNFQFGSKIPLERQLVIGGI